MIGEAALAVVGLSLALAFAVVVARAWRGSRRARDGDRAPLAPLNEERRAPGDGVLPRQGLTEAAQPELSKPAPQRSESHAEHIQELAAHHKTEEQAQTAVEQKLQREAEEEQRRLIEEAARLVSEQEALRQAAEEERSRQAAEAVRLEAELESRRVAEEEAQLAAEEQELERKEEEEQRRLIEEAARLVSEQEALREVEAERARQAAEAARLEAELESRRVAEVVAQLAAEQEIQRKAAEEEALRQVAELARAEAERESRRQADEEVRAAAALETKRRAEEAMRRADEEARMAAEQEIDASTISMQPDEPGHDPIAVQAEDNPLAGEDAIVDSTARAPRQYRPTGRAPSVPRGTPRSSAQSATRERAAPIEVRLVLERAGFCRVSLLPRRAAGMPPKLAVTGSGDPVELAALQDDWYQDVNLSDLGLLLKDGIEWVGSHNGSRARLSLSGREVYVLAPHGELRGFVSAPRLTLGTEHIVLCTAGRLPEVRAAIAIAGSAEPTILDSDSGIPTGWCGLRGVAPRNPIAPSAEGDILDALRPLADVAISLEGGIRIERQTWLCGFPPSIRLRGDPGTIGAVMIDKQEAAIGQDGGYVIPGWDSLGEHSIWCTSDSRKYAIRSGAEEWESWNAYTWSLGESDAGDVVSRPAVCGVLVRPPKAARAGGKGVVVPASNPVLIGAIPGEIAFCTPRSDVRAGLCIGFPWFKPVWALPSDASHCDKRSSRVLLVGSPLPVTEEKEDVAPHDAVRRRQPRQGARAWSNAILTSGRKGLETEPAESEVANLWKTYRRFAKARWRGRR